jgi:NAD(P)-dependent dehydrogenase (short-subunit alcohol dehydrogenase family)
MHSFPDGFRALVIGASGGIGAAFVQALGADSRCAHVQGLHRSSHPAINFDDEASIGTAAHALRDEGPFQLIVVATGMLHTEEHMPEKKLADLNYAQLMQTLQTNTVGPALVLRHFTPLLCRTRGVLAVLSAKVGSIEDNRLGGWYGYRASKAALNMVLKTAAIEVKRSNPQAVLVALHPCTVNSALSKPFRGIEIGRAAADAAQDMLKIIDELSGAHSGQFFSYTGERLPW